jgi:eukaryotic-like serine/threonine-protein kinase
VDAFPDDESLYGVRGLAGGVYDLCNDRWDGEVLRHRDDRPVLEPADEEHFQVVRGGCRTSEVHEARADRRLRLGPGTRSDKVGFRLARSLDDPRPAYRGVAWRFGG